MTTIARPKVVLFDIDETLVHTGGSGARSWTLAFEKLHGKHVDIDEHSSAGETDPQVVDAVFRGALGRTPTASELGRLYAQYLLHLAEDIWISEGYRLLPGVEETLTRLTEAGVTLGLVSGAMEGAARIKLMPANLNRFFVFGGYGSDSPDRPKLTQMAFEKASLLHSQLTAAQVFVIGDTPHDIDAGRAIGAVSIGVATGRYSVDELRSAGGAYVLQSFEDELPGL
ncbi:MAG: HAD family hydrolase [Ferrimicrobium sp.]